MSPMSTETLQKFYKRLASERASRPGNAGQLVAERTRPQQFYLDLVRRALSLDSRIEDFVRELNADIETAQFKIPKQALPFIIVPALTEVLEQKYGVGTISGRMGDNTPYMLGLAMDGGNIVAFDVVGENGVPKIYRAKTPDELRTLLKQAYGGEWWDCVFKPLKFKPAAAQASGEVAQKSYILELVRQHAQSRPAGELVQSHGQHKEFIRQLVHERSNDVPEVELEDIFEPAGLFDNQTEFRDVPEGPAIHRRTRVQKVPGSEPNVDLTGLSYLLGLDEAPAGEAATSIHWPALGGKYKQIASAEAQAHAAPAPMPPVPREAQGQAVTPKEREDRKIDAAGSVITRSEIDSDLVERVINAQTVHIGTLNIHVHNGRVPRDSKGEEE